MKPSNQESQRALCQEILAEARGQADEILREARQEADAVLARATAEAASARQQRLDVAQALAAHRREQLLESVPLEIGRLRAERIEALLSSIHETVRQRLLAREGFDYPEALIALASEAISHMRGETFVVKLSPADRTALGEVVAEGIARRVARSPEFTLRLVPDPSITEGGVIVEDLGGRQVWDNRLPARLERLWPELRRGIVAGADLDSGEHRAGGDA